MIFILIPTYLYNASDNEKFVNKNHFSQDEISIYTVPSSENACTVSIELHKLRSWSDQLLGRMKMILPLVAGIILCSLASSVNGYPNPTEPGNIIMLIQAKPSLVHAFDFEWLMTCAWTFLNVSYSEFKIFSNDEVICMCVTYLLMPNLKSI